MKQLIRKCIAWSVLLLITLHVAACSGPVFPSRGLVVHLSPDGPSALEVKDFVYATLAPRGFADGGIDGRDAITGKRAAYCLRGPSDMQVVLRIDLPSEVPMRINQDRRTFSPEANQTFNELVTALETKWPGTVIAEPRPTK